MRFNKIKKQKDSAGRQKSPIAALLTKASSIDSMYASITGFHYTKFDEHGNLTDDYTREAIKNLLQSLTKKVRTLQI